MTSDTPTNPTDIFLNLIITFLSPLFLPAAAGDIIFARAAATQTVAAYAARHPTDLLPIAQVIAFGFAVLDSLGRSMNENMSDTLALRLRANAATLNRSADQCRRALFDPVPRETANLPDPETLHQQEQEVMAALAKTEKRLARAKAIASTGPAPKKPTQSTSSKPPANQPKQPIPKSEDEIFRNVWATAMTEVAREETIGIAALPPTQRLRATMRASVLSSVAQNLLTGAPHEPWPPEAPLHPHM